ncbi:polysaccharide biosynthesis/export family protein [Leptolyngbya sp. CCNP1308]|uniref:polysaccharide biosynthesis/export family protein n=1 Tax=Leptolyngbya sp. CCNP1308 TaxID=3110255 RepID=UPI002B204374|nr:polysaccharide biosynthesis/export family protein [Leptolyngbya sp. CCNP1308]MEA5452422.1 polysaccharide biosynthesis/export family protein [Leptolyngbya sp. CCNP1308]
MLKNPSFAQRCLRQVALPLCSPLLALGSGLLTPGLANTMGEVIPGSQPLFPSVSQPGRPAPPGPQVYPLDGYRLTVGDIVYVTVANVPDYSGTFQVLPDGSLNLPVLGRVEAWGQTLPEVEQAIAQAYAAAEILVEPRITVSLSQLSPLRVVVIGEVTRPGVYALAPEQGRLPTVAIALDAAGGITQRTDLRSIEVRRVSADNQREETLTVSLWDLLTQGDRNQDIALRDGDTIVVPQADPSIPNARALASSTFSTGAIQVNIVGEIAQPGVMEVPPDTSVSEALLLAGSFTRRSRRVDVQLLRLNLDGTVTQRSLPVDFASAINDETNPLLQDRDVILVGRNWSAALGDSIGTVLQPLSGASSLLNLFLPFLLLR